MKQFEARHEGGGRRGWERRGWENEGRGLEEGRVSEGGDVVMSGYSII